MATRMQRTSANGILIIPLSINAGSVRNVLNVLCSPVVARKYGLPAIRDVEFLRTPEISQVKDGGESLEPWTAVGRITDELGLDGKIKRINDYAVDIPKCILEEVRTVGRENVVLDLTSGKKDITGSLYTSACIAEIPNMVYVDVKRDEATNQFNVLSHDDAHILDKVKLTKFKTIGEIENLASANGMDFIIYKKAVQEIVPRQQDTIDANFNHAIEAYFRKEEHTYRECIRNVGLILERVLVILDSALKRRFPSLWKSDIKVLQAVMDLQQKYEECADPKRRRPGKGTGGKGRAEELNARYGQLHPVFSHFPALFEMLSMLTNFRNLVSHDKRFNPRRDDAKLAMDVMLRLLRSMSELKMLEEES